MILSESISLIMHKFAVVKVRIAVLKASFFPFSHFPETLICFNDRNLFPIGHQTNTMWRSLVDGPTEDPFSSFGISHGFVDDGCDRTIQFELLALSSTSASGGDGSANGLVVPPVTLVQNFAVSINDHSFSVCHTLLPFAFVHASIFPFAFAVAMILSLFELSGINASLEIVFSVSLTSALPKLTLIGGTILPSVQTFAMTNIIEKLSFVETTILPTIFTLPMPLIKPILSSIDISVGEGSRTESMPTPHGKITAVFSIIGVDHFTPTVRQIVLQFTRVLALITGGVR
mmetsp:Transcript_11301/g.16096  ORF Transcript_11301/g.16096 Transcript_11301/m.16096 type:complete len:288 (+) Transcript_11301:222-1085(+)